MQEGFERMLKGFKEFLARGNIVDLSVAVVIGTAFTALVTKFTDSIITPLISRIGVNQKTDVGALRIDLGGGNTIDLNIVLSALISFILVAAVVYFQVVLLTEIRDLLAQTNGDASSGKHGGTATTPPPEHGPRADAESH